MRELVTYARVIKRALALLALEAGETGRAEYAIRHTVTAAKFARQCANEPGATVESAARKLILFVS